jgi:hypothetical protein
MATLCRHPAANLGPLSAAAAGKTINDSTASSNDPAFLNIGLLLGNATGV